MIRRPGLRGLEPRSEQFVRDDPIPTVSRLLDFGSKCLPLASENLRSRSPQMSGPAGTVAAGPDLLSELAIAWGAPSTRRIVCWDYPAFTTIREVVHCRDYEPDAHSPGERRQVSDMNRRVQSSPKNASQDAQPEVSGALNIDEWGNPIGPELRRLRARAVDAARQWIEDR